MSKDNGFEIEHMNLQRGVENQIEKSRRRTDIGDLDRAAVLLMLAYRIGKKSDREDLFKCYRRVILDGPGKSGKRKKKGVIGSLFSGD